MKILHFVHGDKGYTETVPDVSSEKCKECGSSKHWEFVTAQSEAKFDTTFFFLCSNTYVSDEVSYDCTGRLKIRP